MTYLNGMIYISISIATKSDLVLRDIDLIRTFPNARVSFSIGSNHNGNSGLFIESGDL